MLPWRRKRKRRGQAEGLSHRQSCAVGQYGSRGLVRGFGHPLSIRGSFHFHSKTVSAFQVVGFPKTAVVVIRIVESERTVPGGSEILQIRYLGGFVRLGTGEARHLHLGFA